MARVTTLRDIARETGLSQTAVSLVLNNRPNKLSEQSRQSILDAAKRLSYTPKSGRRVSASGSHSTLIGLISSMRSNLFYYTLLEGIEHSARLRGYHVAVGYSDGSYETECDAIRHMMNSGVAGLMYAPVGIEIPDIISVPVVLVGHYFPSYSFSCVTTNCEKGVYEITRYLIQNGHRRIACLDGGFPPYPLPRERAVGYRRAMSEAGLTINDAHVFSGDFSIGDGYRHAGAILATRPKYDAVVCTNDYMAFGFYKRARELGIRIPEDISVTGFDDVLFAEHCEPPLTTVRQPAFDLGVKAATQLISEIEDPSTPHQTVYFEPELVIRESVRSQSAKLQLKT